MKRLLFLSLVCFAQLCMAQIKLPQIIRDSMVLQRDKKVNIWGWASPAEKITITFNNKKYKTTTSAEGKWMAVLPPTKAGGPYSITTAGKNSITLN